MNIVNKNWLLILGIFIVIIVLSGAVFYEKLTEQREIPSPQDERAFQQTEALFGQEVERPTATSSLKTYRNGQFGFEFQYPNGWTFHENTFYSPFSEFNLVGASPEENGRPNPIASPLLINIVTPDFADRAMISKKNLGATIGDFTVGGVRGKRYEYVFEGVSKISIDLPFWEYRLLLSVDKEYEDVFNQILSSFKFLY